MNEPTNNHGALLYAGLPDLVRRIDQDNGGAIAVLCGAIGAMYTKFDTLLREGPHGEISWQQLFDPSLCPDEALPYLAQFVGVRAITSAVALRSRIKAIPTYRRGTLVSLVGAAQLYLTGSKSVTVYERYLDDPYRIHVLTKTSETPDATLVLRSLMEAKPAGLVLSHSTVTGQTFDQLDGAFTSFNAADTAYTSFNQMATG